MPISEENRDLFAGFTVKGESIPAIAQTAAPQQQQAVDNSDLFAGFTVRGQKIPPLQPEQQIEPQLTEQQQARQGGQAKPGIFDFITGASRETPETQELPEIGAVSTGSTGKDLRLAGGLLASLDEQEKIDVITNTDPGATTRKDEKGNVIVKFSNGEESILNKPGFSAQDGLQIASQIAAFSPAARVASFGKLLLAKVGLGAAAAGATETAIQGAAQLAGSEQGFDKGRIATATALGGAAELVQPIAQAVAKRAGAKKLTTKSADIETPQELAEVTELAKTGQKAAKETDIPLTRAQQTGIESELNRQRTVASLPAGARTSKAFLDKQSQKASEAVDELLDAIAPSTAVETGETQFRTAAQKAIAARKAVRTQKSDKLFAEAMRKGGNTDLTNTKSLIDNVLKDAPETGDLQKSIIKVSKLIGDDSSSLKKLQNAKFQIDAMIDGSGGKVIDETIKRELVPIQQSLVKAMENASPLYKQANKAFAEASPAIKELQDSILGRVGAVSDTQLKSISGKIFDPAQTNTATIKAAKKVIDQVDPSAWNQLLRIELEKRLGKVRADLTDISGENVPSMLRTAIFGNSKQRNVLMAGATDDIKKNLSFMEDALKRATKGRPGGPDTAFKLESIAEFKKRGSIRAVIDFFTSPARVLTEQGDQLLNDKKIRATAKILFDPDWTPKLTEVRKMTNRQKQQQAMGKLLNDVFKATDQELKGAAQAVREQTQQE